MLSTVRPEKRKVLAIAEMVTRLVQVRTLRAKLKTEDQDLTAALLKAGEYKLLGKSGEYALAIHPSPKIVIVADKVPSLKKLLEDHFYSLIEEVKQWKAVKACREIAEKILSPSENRQFLSQTEVECEPYIRIP